MTGACAISPAPRHVDRASPAAALAAALCGAVASAAACPLPAALPGEQRLTQGEVQLAWQAEPAALVVGRPFALAIRICPAQARLLRVDATMPEHRHGMNYRPSVQALGDSRWRSEGLLWHMAGRWELAFEVEHAGKPDWLRQSVTLAH
jgi:hypothetical protein